MKSSFYLYTYLNTVVVHLWVPVSLAKNAKVSVSESFFLFTNFVKDSDNIHLTSFYDQKLMFNLIDQLFDMIYYCVFIKLCFTSLTSFYISLC